MALSTMKKEYMELRSDMLEKGIIDDRFLKLQTIQEGNNSDFGFNLIDGFNIEVEQIISELNKSVDMKQIDLALADTFVNKLRGITSCLGVPKLTNLTDEFRSSYLENNVDGCLRAVFRMNEEFIFCKDKLEALKNLAEQICAAGGSLPA